MSPIRAKRCYGSVWVLWMYFRNKLATHDTESPTMDDVNILKLADALGNDAYAAMYDYLINRFEADLTQLQIQAIAFKTSAIAESVVVSTIQYAGHKP